MKPIILISLPDELAEDDCACPDSSHETLHVVEEHVGTELQVSLQIPRVSLSDMQEADRL